MNPYERDVTLTDGRVVSNYSEEWRAECEARMVCQMLNRDARARYMEKVKARRGDAVHAALHDMVLRIWNAEFRS